jgi:limonene-1,2-epoxide hydrolase
VVRRYLDRLVAHDWDAVEACLAGSVERVGPFGDTVAGRHEYLAFLRRVMPSLPGYAMRVDRIIAAGPPGDDRSGAGAVLAELTETVSMDGAPQDTAEALVFEVDREDQIVRVAIYLRQIP